MNSRGIIGLPIRLTIAFLIIALATPIMVSVVDDFRENNELNEVRQETKNFTENAKNIWYSGNGSCVTLDLNILHGWHIVAGGKGQDAWSYSILKNGTTIEKTFTDSPKIRFFGNGVDLFGICSVKLSCINDSEGNYGILVERI